MYVLVFYGKDHFTVGGVSTDLNLLQNEAEKLLGITPETTWIYQWEDNFYDKTKLENTIYYLVHEEPLFLNNASVNSVEISLHLPDHIHAIGY